MNILILEDDLLRMESFYKNFAGHNIVIVEHAKECISYLKEQEWDILFLDHDLGGMQMVDSDEEDTGATVAKFINKNSQYKPAIVIIHSMNPVGAQLMSDLIPGSRRIPGAWRMQLA